MVYYRLSSGKVPQISDHQSETPEFDPIKALKLQCRTSRKLSQPLFEVTVSPSSLSILLPPPPPPPPQKRQILMLVKSNNLHIFLPSKLIVNPV